MKTLRRKFERVRERVFESIDYHLQNPSSFCLCNYFKVVDSLRELLLEIVRKIEKKI